MVHWIKIGSG